MLVFFLFFFKEYLGDANYKESKDAWWLADCLLLDNHYDNISLLYFIAVL